MKILKYSFELHYLFIHLVLCPYLLPISICLRLRFDFYQKFQTLNQSLLFLSGFNDNEICDFVEMTRDKPIDIRFIEYMPFSGNKWETEKMVSYRLVDSELFESIPSTLNELYFFLCS